MKKSIFSAMMLVACNQMFATTAGTIDQVTIMNKSSSYSMEVGNTVQKGNTDALADKTTIKAGGAANVYIKPGGTFTLVAINSTTNARSSIESVQRKGNSKSEFPCSYYVDYSGLSKKFDIKTGDLKKNE